MSASLTSINSSCTSLSNGSATTIVLGGTLPYSYAWSNGATTASISSLDAGTYTVTIQDDNLCPSYVLSVTITNDATITSTVTSTNVSCNGGSNGSVAVSPIGGTAPYTYLWNGGASNSSINGLNANTYSVIITDDNGCSNVETISITEPTAISATSSSTDANCNGSTDGSVSILNVSGGIIPYSYEWSNGDLNATANGLAAGTYTVTVTDDNGCVFVTDATVSEPTLIIANVTTTKTNCFGLSDGEASSTPSGGVAPYTYSWSDGQTTATASGLTAQTYTLVITDNHGCTQTEFATVLQPDSISTSYTSIDTRCFNDSNGSATITAIGGTAPYTYNWSTGNIGDTENGLTAGTYSVTVVDDNGCVSFENITINQPDSLAMNITTQSVTCHGLSDGAAFANPTGGTSPYTFNWGTGTTSATSLSGLIAQSFSVLITDDNGCINAESVAINEPDTISATITTTDPLCNGGTGSATATAIGGTGTLYYAWSSGGSNATETNLLADTYLLAITDDNGCSIDKVVTINEPSKISVTSSSVSANCGQSNGSAFVVATGGTGNFTYSWSSGGTTDVENNLAAGNYTVTITDAYGCSSTETVSISNIGAPSVVVSQTSVLCNGDNNGTIDLTVSGGTPNYTYTWSNGATTGNLTGLAPITYSYTITDAANCQTVGTVTITEPDALAITSTTTNDSGSNNGSIDITVTGGVTSYTFDWSNGSTSEDLTNLAAGIYTVIVTDSYGCSRTETITVSSSVGINQIEVNNSFIVYPNPNNGQFNISGNKTMNYELKNNLGQIIQRIQLNANNHYAGSINNLSSGVYFINSEDSNSKTIKKIVVIK